MTSQVATMRNLMTRSGNPVSTCFGAVGLVVAAAIVAVGCNDALRLVRPAEFGVTFAAILRALGSSGASVVAVGVPDLGSMMAVMAQPLRAVVGLAAQRLDKTVRDVANDTGASYVAIHDRMSGGGRRRGRPALSADAWHPSGDGYRIWAERVAAHMVDLDPSGS